MPNWSYNTIALQGKRDAVHAFIKIGLTNSGLPTSDDIEKDFNLLVAEGKTKVGKREDEKDFNSPVHIQMDKWLSARTFLPIPDTYILHDTTNNPNAYSLDIVKEQMAMGTVGWYDYNIHTLGTKWNFGIEDGLSLTEFKDDKFRILFNCETAWSIPDQWLYKMKELVPDLNIFIQANEEGNAYIFCGMVVEEYGEYTISDYADYTNEFEKMWKSFNKQRETYRKELKTKIDELRNEVIKEWNEENPDDDISDEEINSRIDDKIEDMVNDKYGEFLDESELFDKLDDSFCKMLEENL